MPAPGLLLYILTFAAITHASENFWGVPSNDSFTAVCYTGRQLALAFADASVGVAAIANDITLSNGDWDGVPTPVILNRNLTIVGLRLEPYLLDLNRISGKVQLNVGAALSICGLGLSGMRAKPINVSPGLDLLAVSPPVNSSAERTPLFIVKGGIVLTRFCFPLNQDLQSRNYGGLTRAQGFPGANSLIYGQRQPNCINSTSVPVTQRCWPSRGVLVDLALNAVDIVNNDVQVPANYVVRVLNASFACNQMVTEECVERFGPGGCLLQMLAAAQQQQPPPPPPLEPLLQREQQPSQHHQNHGQRTSAILAGTIAAGGFLVASTVVLTAIVIQRRRQRCRRSALDSAATATPCEDNSSRFDGVGAVSACLQPPSKQAQGAAPGLPSPESGAADGAQTALAVAAGDDVASAVAAALVVVSALTPPRPDIQLDVECGNELKLEATTLGKGACGRVVVGTFQGRKVAVKLITDAAEAAADPEMIELLQQEVEILGRCQHPNVVRLLAANLAPPRPCLVMELVETSLEALMYGKPETLLPLPVVLHIALGIARGLEYLHPTVLHRDLKPSNVLINNPNSARPVAKLADFGLSRLRHSLLVTTHPEAGTPPYMAPECFDLENFEISHKSDIYSLGVIIAEMLAGKKPWPGLQMIHIAWNVTLKDQRPRLLDDLTAERCPPRLRSLVVDCWEKDPMRRPAAAELVKILLLLQEAPPQLRQQQQQQQEPNQEQQG